MRPAPAERRSRDDLTAFSSGTSKKDRTGVSGMQVRSSLRIASRTARLDDQRERLGLGDQRLGGMGQRLGDAAAQIGSITWRRAVSARMAWPSSPSSWPSSVMTRKRLAHPAQFLDDERAQLRPDQLDNLFGVERLLPPRRSRWRCGGTPSR
jgi:hypothetical protein